MRFRKLKWAVISLVTVLVALSAVLGIRVSATPVVDYPSIQVGSSQFTLTVGHVAYAAETADYTCDGTDDDVQFQTALDALPSLGGKIVVLAGNYSFSDVVSRAIDDVTIEGAGMASYIARDASNPTFDAGTQSDWVFRNLEFDTGGVDVSSASNWTKENVLEGTTYVGLQTSSFGDILPVADSTYNIGASSNEWAEGYFDSLTLSGSSVVRDTTLVVCADDSLETGQCDYLCDGTADEVQINAALTSAATVGGTVVLMEGNFDISGTTTVAVVVDPLIEVETSIVVPSNVTLRGQGIDRTTIQYTGTIASDGNDTAVIGRKTGQTASQPPGVDTVWIADLTVDMNDLASRGLDFKSTYRTTISRVEVKGLTSFADIAAHGIGIGVSAYADADYGDFLIEDVIITGDNTELGLGGTKGILIDGRHVRGVMVRNPRITTCSTGISIDDAVWDATIENPQIENSDASGISTGSPANNIRKVKGLRILGGWLYNCGDGGTDSAINLDNTDGAIVEGVHIQSVEAAANWGIHIWRQSSAIISNNHIEGHLVGVVLRSSAYWAEITGNLVERNRNSGILYYATIVQGALVTGNTIRNNGLETSDGDTARCGITVTNEDGLSVLGNWIGDNSSTITSSLQANAGADPNTVVKVSPGEDYFVGQRVEISDDAPHDEELTILSIAYPGTTYVELTMTTVLTHAYTTGDNAVLVGVATQRYGYAEVTGNGSGNVVRGNTFSGNSLSAVSAYADTEIRANAGFVASGDLVAIYKTVDHADIVDDGGATGHVDFDDEIPAGSLGQSVKFNYTESFNSDDTTTFTIMVGPPGDLDAFNKTASPGENAFNHTTDAYWGESEFQDYVLITAQTPRITFTEDDDITDIISSGNAQGGITITIVYLKS